MRILVIDIGTTSTRGILFGPDGEVIDARSVSTPLITSPETGYIEQSPEHYRRIVTGLARDVAVGRDVDAIAVTAYRSAPALFDRDGEPLTRFIMWQDTRNSGICHRLAPESDVIYQRSGARLNTVFTASKLTWFRENMPEAWRRAWKAMIVPDYVIHLMTGEFTTDRTYGSRTHVMDIRTLEWDPELCAIFGIEMDKLCELRDQGSIVGRVSERFSRETGIPSGVPVISAGGDQQCGALGLGVLDHSTIEVNSGTGSFVISLVDRPILENPSVICNVAAVPGMYTQEMNIIASASAVNWLVREVFPELWGDPPDFDAVNRIAAATPPGAHGLCVVPHFQGCGSRDWNPDARAVFAGFSLSSSRSDLIRALYEGIAAEIAKSIDVLPEICRGADSIAVAGGLSKSDVYNRILCDMTNRTLTRGANTQATALGAYISTAVALGHYAGYREAFEAARDTSADAVYRPDADTARFYRDYVARTERLYRAEACRQQG